ncbi:MAG: hypothetical protein M1576_00770 [Deltaproteobacteria bacterium]|nr:hypothetical protein [Deltaproteobacteria bacterium]
MENKNVNIYRRLLKYPPFAVSRKGGAMIISHKLKNGKEIIAIAPEYVTVEDAEKLYTVCYLAQRDETFKIINTEKFGKMAEITVFIWDIRKLTNCNDDGYIYKALDRITGIKIQYNFEKNKTSVHIINAVKFNQKTGEINILMDLTMFKNFAGKSLTINIEKYNSLTPVAKNLYGWISHNKPVQYIQRKYANRACCHTGQTKK